jgi:hypothetical protein
MDIEPVMSSISAARARPALDGGDAEIARLAFRRAVEEAGNLIGDVDRVHKSADPSYLSLSKRHSAASMPRARAAWCS